MKLTLFTLSTIAVLACGDAHAASFDCSKASAPDEFTVCDSRELSQLDVKMATLYETVIKLVGMGVRGDLQDQQRVFLRARSDCGHDRMCIRNLYTARIHALETEVTRISRGGPY
ncbi:MAG: hypothetical protein GEU95_22005 [Rhizobiales bacterium]|nr:hypothetical protein [Hyphomicrobiales bacterium]